MIFWRFFLSGVVCDDCDTDKSNGLIYPVNFDIVNVLTFVVNQLIERLANFLTEQSFSLRLIAVLNYHIRIKDYTYELDFRQRRMLRRMRIHYCTALSFPLSIPLKQTELNAGL